VPEVREFLFARYFFDLPQALFVLGLLGTVFLALSPVALVLWMPYGLFRAVEPTRSLKGPLRVIRSLIYFPKDALAFLVLLIGSVRFRSLVL
jgi:hypothetical protein